MTLFATDGADIKFKPTKAGPDDFVFILQDNVRSDYCSVLEYVSRMEDLSQGSKSGRANHRKEHDLMTLKPPPPNKSDASKKSSIL